MRRILPELTPELTTHFGDNTKVGSIEAYPINTYRQLVEHIAKLAFRNKDHLLFYRGQKSDYKNRKGTSTFYPTIYRGDYLRHREIRNRFEILDGASKVLVDRFVDNKIDGFSEVKRRKSIQWSILQHYEVCDTPLLDFTHSLRVACSFATLNNDSKDAFVFVFGLPYITNRISINSEHDIINVRLLSICPPTALRPYFQEGYLAGTDDITINYDSKSELDFNNRIIAKFKIINSKTFWTGGFDKIPEKSLYPTKDPINEICQEIKSIAVRELRAGDLGEFLKLWSEIEEILITRAKNYSQRLFSAREAIRLLYEKGQISKDLLIQLDRIRQFRNMVVHTPKKITSGQLQDYLYSVDDLLEQVKI